MHPTHPSPSYHAQPTQPTPPGASSTAKDACTTCSCAIGRGVQAIALKRGHQLGGAQNQQESVICYSEMATLLIEKGVVSKEAVTSGYLSNGEACRAYTGAWTPAAKDVYCAAVWSKFGGRA